MNVSILVLLVQRKCTLHNVWGYRELAARWIPHEISEVQKWYRYVVAQALFVRYRTSSFFMAMQGVIL